MFLNPSLWIQCGMAPPPHTGQHAHLHAHTPPKAAVTPPLVLRAASYQGPSEAEMITVIIPLLGSSGTSLNAHTHNSTPLIHEADVTSDKVSSTNWDLKFHTLNRHPSTVCLFENGLWITFARFQLLITLFCRSFSHNVISFSGRSCNVTIPLRIVVTLHHEEIWHGLFLITVYKTPPSSQMPKSYCIKTQ